MSGELADHAKWLIDSIGRSLREIGGTGVNDVLRRLAEQDLSSNGVIDCESRQLPVCRYLSETVAASMMVAPSVAAASAACVNDLHWRQTPGYSDALLGPGFMDDYGHCELIGPRGVFAGHDFLLGLLLLGPGRHYLDHHHPAPELYWPLTGANQWKLGDGPFVAKQPGETVWHEPHVIHATRTGDAPMLAVWCWTRDIGQSARLVAAAA